jgi:hypothetical protein
VFGPLTVASLVFCREDSSVSWWRGPHFALDRPRQNEFWRFFRSREAVPPTSIGTEALFWAEGVVTQHRCPWNRVLNWAWVLWIGAGVVTAIAFRSTQYVALQLIVFDLVLLAAFTNRRTLHHARAVLAAAGRTRT